MESTVDCKYDNHGNELQPSSLEMKEHTSMTASQSAHVEGSGHKCDIHLKAQHQTLFAEKNSDSKNEKYKMPPDPDPERCQFYLRNKQRYCRTRPCHGSKYCVAHAFDVAQDKPEACQSFGKEMRKRIPCPLDANHTVYETKLQSHLKKCNVTKQKDNMPSYYVPSINLSAVDKDICKDSIRDIPNSEVLELVETVRKLHSEHVGMLATDVLFHDVMKEQSENPTNGQAAQKHIQQQASLIGHMEKAGLLGDHSTYIEFGAGKGGLSHWVQLALSHASNNQYVLIDRGSVRYKLDNFHKGDHQGPTFKRIRIDIQDLHLGKLDYIASDPRRVVGMGKHLCGGATDLMLRCLMESQLRTSQVAGLVLAVCCHHRCEWSSYVGQEFFRLCGLTAREFYLIRSMTSWATCGANLVAEHSEHSTASETEQQNAYHHHRYGSLGPEAREEVGRQCKQLIDKGRELYLHSKGYQAHLSCFVDRKHTLENMAIVAHQGSDI